jgi:hypothetical protein
MKTLKTLSLVSAILLSSSFYSQCIKGNCHKGHGTFTWDNGDYYEGSWVNGIQHGYGDFYWENGDHYKGKFKEGKIKGLGKYTWENGDWFDGTWVDDKMNGQGTYFWAKSGAKYEGYFKDDKIVETENQETQETPSKEGN